MRMKMSKQHSLAPTASAEGPCHTIIQIVGRRPGTVSLPKTMAPPDHPVKLRYVFKDHILTNPQNKGSILIVMSREQYFVFRHVYKGRQLLRIPVYFTRQRNPSKEVKVLLSAKFIICDGHWKYGRFRKI